MTVKDLIKFLKTKPQHLQVGYSCMSEYALLDEKDIEIMDAGEVRPDGWIARQRPDKLVETYLMFPG